MELVELVRQTLRSRLIPAALSEGVARMRLPEDLPCGDEPETQRWGPEDHGHPQFELCCFLKGMWPLWVEDRLVPFEPGSLLLLPPYVKHSHPVRVFRQVPSFSLRNAPTALWLGLYPFGATGQLMQTIGDTRERMVACPLADQRVFEAAELLLQEMRQQGEGCEAVAQALLLEILSRIARAPLLRGITSPEDVAVPAATVVPASDLVDAARAYLHRRYHHDVSLPGIAHHLSVSPSYLSRRFRKDTGRTVIGYLTDVRIGAAKQLLQTRLDIRSVAELVGFADADYFGRVFRQTTGESPSAFRERQGG